MAGKICTGYENNNSFRIGATQAFADGALYRGGGPAAGRPRANNPHPVGSEDYNAWDAGWVSIHSYAGGRFPSTGCLAPIDDVPL